MNVKTKELLMPVLLSIGLLLTIVVPTSLVLVAWRGAESDVRFYRGLYEDEKKNAGYWKNESQLYYETSQEQADYYETFCSVSKKPKLALPLRIKLIPKPAWASSSNTANRKHGRRHKTVKPAISGSPAQ